MNRTRCTHQRQDSNLQTVDFSTEYVPVNQVGMSPSEKKSLARRVLMGNPFRAVARAARVTEAAVQDSLIEYFRAEVAAAEKRGLARGRLSVERFGLTRAWAR